MLKKLELKVPPPAVFITTVVLMWLTSRYTAAGLYTIPTPYRWGLIAALLVLALFFGLGGAWRLHQSRSTLSPHHPEQTDSLTVSGVFRLTRNPMYRALLLGLVAWSAYLESALAAGFRNLCITWCASDL